MYCHLERQWRSKPDRPSRSPTSTATPSPISSPLSITGSQVTLDTLTGNGSGGFLPGATVHINASRAGITPPAVLAADLNEQ